MSSSGLITTTAVRSRRRSSRAAGRRAGFGSFMDYYYLLKYPPTSRTTGSKVMDALAVQETYFWREIDQLRAVVDLIVPANSREQRGRPAADLEQRLRDRRGAADAGDAAR